MKLYYVTGFLISLLMYKMDLNYKTKYAVALFILLTLTCLLFLADELDLIHKIWR